MTTRIALYARFSSDLQNPTSASDQLRYLRAEIARRGLGWEVVAEDRDEAVSGTSMEGRDGLRRLLARARERPRPFDAIVVEDLSRLARNRADSVRLREELTECGVQVLSAADGFVDPESDAGHFLTGIKELKAEADSRETGRRVRRGVKARTTLGWVSGRRTPFGYCRVPVFSETERDRDGRPVRLGVRYEPDPVTGPIVTCIFERYASGIGLHRIANELNDPQGPYRSAKPKGFITSFLRAVLLNPVYRGDVVYARTKERKVRVGDRVKRRKTAVPSAEQAIGAKAHVALVDPVTWGKVAGRFASRAGLGSSAACAVAGQGRAPASLLSGLVRCGVCGGGFVVWTSGPNPKQHARGLRTSMRRFVCGRRRSSGADVCSNETTIEMRDLEQRVLDALESRVLTPEGLRHLEKQRAGFLLDGLRALTDRAPAIEREWAETALAEGRLVEALKAGIGLEAVREEATRLQERRAALERERGQVAMLHRLQAAAAQRQTSSRPLARLRDILDLPDLGEVREALREVIVRIEIGGEGDPRLVIGEGPLEPLPRGDGLPTLSDMTSLAGRDAAGSLDSRVRPALPAGDGHGAVPLGTRPVSRLFVVGATGFEPATSWSRTKRATKLRYAPERRTDGRSIPGADGSATPGEGGTGGGKAEAGRDRQAGPGGHRVCCRGPRERAALWVIPLPRDPDPRPA